MVYSLSFLTTKAQCDIVLAIAAEKRKTLAFRDTEGDFRTDNTSKTATSLHNELSSLNTYIAAMTPVIPTLSAGKERDEAQDELRKKTDRRDELVSRQGKQGGEKLVERELKQALLEPQLPVLDDFVQQVTDYKNKLTA
jgi:hypothetical protein